MNYDHPDSTVLIFGLYKSPVRPCDATCQAGYHDETIKSEIHKSIILFLRAACRIAESEGVPVQLSGEKIYLNTRLLLRLEMFVRHSWDVCVFYIPATKAHVGQC